jgi:hypothetical protein
MRPHRPLLLLNQKQNYYHHCLLRRCLFHLHRLRQL